MLCGVVFCVLLYDYMFSVFLLMAVINQYNFRLEVGRYFLRFRRIAGIALRNKNNFLSYL